MNGLRYYGVRVEGAKYGMGFGSALAIAMSYTTHHSILWAIIHGIFGWLYVIYLPCFGRDRLLASRRNCSRDGWRDGTKSTTRDNLKRMEYRGVEYTVVQGIKRGVWKWSASVADVLIMGQASTKSAAAAAAERAIDKALAPAGVRLVPPEHGD